LVQLQFPLIERKIESQAEKIMSKFYAFHLVENSPWPIFGSFSCFVLTISGVLYMKGYKYGLILLYIALVLLILTFGFWFRDIIREATYQGHHTKKVRKGLQLGMILFIISEICFFAAFFWAYFHSSLTPAVELGSIWPPKGIAILNPWNVPLLNTVLLLSSGATVTWAHFSIIANNRREAILALFLTIFFAILFTALQGYEYYEAGFTIADGVYGSTFFMATGFHGFHVIIGTIFLSVSLIRLIQYHLTNLHHFGFEAAAWYWHFVDVVWLFLFVSIYWWGS
jgi:cytochrome c oxidase subunit 3